MEKVTKSQLETMIENIVKSSTEVVAKEQGVAIESLQTTVDAKIKEIMDQFKDRTLVDVKKKVVPGAGSGIEVGDPVLSKDPKGGFSCLSHFASHVARNTKSGNRVISKELGEWEAIQDRYQWDKNADGTWSVFKAASETSLRTDDSEFGAFLIPPEFRNELWLAVEQSNEILPRCMQIPMATNSVKIPYVNGFDESAGLVYGGIEWKWLDELASKTETRPKFGRIGMELHKLAGLAYCSDEILEDSPISMENILKNGFRDGLNFQMMKMPIRGTGAGQPLGILNAPCLVTVAIEDGQKTATLVFENVIKMYSRISDIKNAVWMANSDCLPQLCTMTIDVGTGGVAVYMPANGAAGVPYDTLFGKPLIWNKHCSTVGTVGDIVLCDWSQYLVGQKAGQGSTGKFDTSIHLKFDADQTAFRFVFRIDGQPWWPSALTPPQSANTISPFVALATRA